MTLWLRSLFLATLLLVAPAAYATDVCSADWSETDASNNVAAPRGWPEGMAPSGVNDAGRAMMGATKRWWNRNNGVKTTAGTNTITVSYDVAAAAYCTGERFLLKAGGTNTGAATLNVNSLGAKTVKTLQGNALVGGEIISGQYFEVVYDGTDMLLLTKHQGLVYSRKQTVSASTSVSFDSLPAYDDMEISFSGVVAGTANDSLLLRLGFGASAASDAQYIYNVLENISSAATATRQSGQTSIALTGALDDTANYAANGRFFITGYATAGAYKQVIGTSAYIKNGAAEARLDVHGIYVNSTAAIDRFTLLMAANWSGVVTVKLYKN